ncbi:MAG: Gfo/Idh/MocA family oxidoreductase [Candidatus Babeliales bacterium]|jgi:predicted dehydrogenase
MLKVAIIGIGKQGWDNILPSLAQIKTISTVATCDIDKNKADLAARNYGAKSYCDYKKMIENEELDAIIVASYPNVHYNVTKLALEKGIAIFIEKPPTFTLEELETLGKDTFNSLVEHCKETGDH